KKIKHLTRQNPAKPGKIRNPRATRTRRSRPATNLLTNLLSMKTVNDSTYDRQKDDMRCRKAMTKAKLDANRQNSKRSTGPRTERGKRIARFNAVTLGLFAKHIVIPICDGYRSEKEVQSLLDGLHQEFQPAGIFEEWLVVKIAE